MQVMRTNLQLLRAALYFLRYRAEWFVGRRAENLTCLLWKLFYITMGPPPTLHM
jgi:hypothetical protein